MAGQKRITYTNPVYADSFPDPFVLRHDGEYYAFCTGHARDGRVFGMLHSRDLVGWDELSGAMESLDPGVAAGDLYWAPEVSLYGNTFYLYYSVGNEALMHIRVAAADVPQGPYVDTGHVLTTQDFAIDPHVFIDDDGSRHMFYATDFLDYSHIGTGTVVDRMIDPFTLAGDPRPATRAKYDWQVYDPAREEKGGVRWHTVEGPFVLKRKGTYFEMFSGGNWQNISYGVGYAVSDSLRSDEEWTQQIDGADTLPLLRTIPGRVIGPGHNSVVAGPNDHELFCVYHRWQDDKRVMCIDRMDFAGGDRMFVTGPSWEAQPAPYRPSSFIFEELFEDGDLSGRSWTVGGAFDVVRGNLQMIGGEGGARLTKRVSAGNFELAVNLKLADLAVDDVTFSLGCGTAAVLQQHTHKWTLNAIELPAEFTPLVFHQVRIVRGDESARIHIDGDEFGPFAPTPHSNALDISVRHATAVLDMVRYTLI